MVVRKKKSKDEEGLVLWSDDETWSDEIESDGSME